MDSERKQLLHELEKEVGYRFQELSILNRAMTHSSYVNEHRDKNARDNERLEFLGDVVVNLLVSDVLFRNYPDSPEGELTKRRSIIVSEPSFAKAARILSLHRYLLLGRGEALSGGARRDSLLADAFEALCGAIYLDSDYATTAKVLYDRLHEAAAVGFEEGTLFKDYKSRLQEHCQKGGRDRVTYRIEREEGPDHDKRFTVSVTARNRVLGEGQGRSKKEAEQAAARQALETLGLIEKS